ncbi:MAG TPA: hypothetical protein DDZ51_17055 [Planctomycetaceae bacterium]|nr:hypothetical protein [Planctomycetaceae bacterium]
MLFTRCLTRYPVGERSGQERWLSCVANEDSALFDEWRTCGSPALQKYLTKAFECWLVTDFWFPYDEVVFAAKQHQNAVLDTITERSLRFYLSADAAAGI